MLDHYLHTAHGAALHAVTRAAGGLVVEVVFPIASTESYRASVDSRDHLGVVASHQLMDTPAVTAVLTQYDEHAVACRCGRVHAAAPPAGAGAWSSLVRFAQGSNAEISFAVSSSSKDSRSITWHQWQAE